MTVSSHVPLVREAVLALLDPQVVPLVGEAWSGNPGHPGCFELPLPSGHVARVDYMDTYGVVVDDRDQSPWRAVDLVDTDGVDMTEDTDPAVVAAAAVAVLRDLWSRDAEGTLDEFGINIS